MKQDALLTYRSIFDQLSTAMDGYDALGEDARARVGRLVEAISDPDVFRLQVREVAPAIGQKMPAELEARARRVV